MRKPTDEEFRAGIEAEGWAVTHEEIEAVDERDPEIARVIELIRQRADRVQQTITEGAFPLVLAGNCNSALSTTAGLGADHLGVVWFDAHADFDDPEENTSGFFDVMGLAMLTGWGLGRISSNRPRPRRSGAVQKRDNRPPAPRPAGVSTHRSRLDRHRRSPANKYAAPRGPGLSRLLDCLRETAEHLDLAGAAITAYDPAFDADDRTISAARAIANELARGIRLDPTSPTG